MPWTKQGPYSTGGALTAANANNIEAQYTEASLSFDPDLFTPFVLSGLVATKDGSVANKLDVTAGTAYPLQADGTLRQRAMSATSFTTSVPSTTYHLYLQPDGTWYWSTSNSPAANSLAVATVTTDGAGNILAVTDARVLNTTLLSGAAGTVTIAASAYVSKAGDTMTGALTAPAFHGPADHVPASGITSGTVPGGVALSALSSDGGALTSDGSGHVTAASLTGPAASDLTVAAAGSSGHVLFKFGGSQSIFVNSSGVGFNVGGGALIGVAAFTGNGSGTYTHGCNVAPNFVGVTMNVVGSTTTVGVDTIGSSTVHVNDFGGGLFVAMAYVF